MDGDPAFPPLLIIVRLRVLSNFNPLLFGALHPNPYYRLRTDPLEFGVVADAEEGQGPGGVVWHGGKRHALASARRPYTHTHIHSGRGTGGRGHSPLTPSFNGARATGDRVRTDIAGPTSHAR